MHFKYKETNRLKLNVWEKVYRANTNAKNAEVNILLSEQLIIGNYECYLIIIKEPIHQRT